MNRKTTGRLLVSVVALTLVIAGSAGATLQGEHTNTTTTVESDVSAVDRPDANAADRQVTACDYTQLYDDVSTAVVEILAHNRTAAWGGSGWIYRIDGSTAYVVTNWHVVEFGNPTDVDVRFEGGQWVEAEVVGTSDVMDTGVVRVENVSESATALPIVQDPIERGQPIAVFGQPLLFEESITEGIISGVDRSMSFPAPTLDDINRTIAPMIQTDAGIEPGNSGGPWVNCQGEVLGMTVGGYYLTTVNFGLSSQALRVIVPEIIANESYPLSYLGANVTNVDALVAEVNDLNTTRGVMVTDLTPNSPARDALRPAPAVDKQFGVPFGGDVILTVDGARVEDASDLYTFLYLETRPNETANFTVLRDGRRRTVSVTLGEYPALPTMPANETTPEPPANETTTEERAGTEA